MTDQQQINRGLQAQQLAENPLLQEALQAWQSAITKQWMESPLRDVDGRERLRLMLEASKTFQQFLEATISTGKVAQATVEQKQQLRKVPTRVLRQA